MSQTPEAARRASDPDALLRLVRASICVAAIGSWIALVVLSLVPGVARPRTGLSGNTEHFIAYLLAAFATRLVFERPSGLWQIAGFSAAAGAFEILQTWVPGRTPAVDNWATSLAGAAVGVGLAVGVTHLIRGRARASSARIESP